MPLTGAKNQAAPREIQMRVNRFGPGALLSVLLLAACAEPMTQAEAVPQATAQLQTATFALG